MNEGYIKLSRTEKDALSQAVSALYFGDNSDIRGRKMRHVFMKEVRLIKYYLGFAGYFYYHPISVNEENDNVGTIYEKTEHVEWKKFGVSDVIQRELEVGENFYYNDKNYNIIKKSISISGEIICYLNEVEFVEDSASKKIAERDFELRKLIIKDRLEQRLKLYDENNKKPQKKLYQFWK